MGKIMEELSKKAASVIAIWIFSIALAFSGAVMALGKAALEDNTVALQKYESTSKKVVSDLSKITKMLEESRMSLFKDKMRLLSKQAYKINNDPDDIKPIDIEAASDFCESVLFKDLVGTVGGSDKLLAKKACSSANSYLTRNPT
jgi:hypothetical protein